MCLQNPQILDKWEQIHLFLNATVHFLWFKSVHCCGLQQHAVGFSIYFLLLVAAHHNISTVCHTFILLYGGPPARTYVGGPRSYIQYYIIGPFKDMFYFFFIICTKRLSASKHSKKTSQACIFFGKPKLPKLFCTLVNLFIGYNVKHICGHSEIVVIHSRLLFYELWCFFPLSGHYTLAVMWSHSWSF